MSRVLATLQAATIGTPFLPRASASGLSPGLHSPDPLGRTRKWHDDSVTSPKGTPEHFAIEEPQSADSLDHRRPSELLLFDQREHVGSRFWDSHLLDGTPIEPNEILNGSKITVSRPRAQAPQLQFLLHLFVGDEALVLRLRISLRVSLLCFPELTKPALEGRASGRNLERI